MKKIPLTQGKVALVDDEDFAELSRYRWFFNRYAVRNSESFGGKRKRIAMHRVLLSPEKGQETDHVNGNRLDNQRENLRVCTNAENNRNVGLRSDNTSGYKGVFLDKRVKAKRWRARIRIDSKLQYIGSFITKTEAALAYNEAAKKYHGEFASLNKLDTIINRR